MIERIKKTAAALSIGAVGVCSARIYSELEEKLTANTPMVPDNVEERINPFLIMPTAKSIIVCLFPYYNGNKKGNISLYARGEDYHLVVARKLNTLAEILEENGFSAKIFCDNGALCDRHLAYLSGLGFVGKNRFLINSEYGTYTFIGYIITDAELKPDKTILAECSNCGRCIKACPGGALSETGLDAQKCVSYITQKKGELTNEEMEAVKRSGSAWGCDICQIVCPHNEGIRLTGISQFRENLIDSLSSDMAESNREFKKMFANRAFSWRGYEVIKRNLKIIGEE